MYTWEDHEQRLLGKLGLIFSREQSALDVGCGRGTMSYIIAQQAGKVIGVDIQANAAWKEFESKLANLEFQAADACKLPFSSDMFDVVFTKDLLHHVPVPELAIAEMKRVTRRGGIIVIVESNRYNPIKYIFTYKILGHKHFSRKYFERLIMSKLSGVEFKSFEDHYYPMKTKLGKYLLFAVDRVFEKTPLLNRFLGYNVAIARKWE